MYLHEFNELLKINTKIESHGNKKGGTKHHPISYILNIQTH